jgi:hypothetical protein
MGNIQLTKTSLRSDGICGTVYKRGPSDTLSIDKDAYTPIVHEYLRSINVFKHYDREQPLEPIDIALYTDYRHIYKRQRILQFMWPQCVGIPMLYFDLERGGMDVFSGQCPLVGYDRLPFHSGSTDTVMWAGGFRCIDPMSMTCSNNSARRIPMVGCLLCLDG